MEPEQANGIIEASNHLHRMVRQLLVVLIVVAVVGLGNIYVILQLSENVDDNTEHIEEIEGTARNIELLVDRVEDNYSLLCEQFPGSMICEVNG